MVAHPAFHSFKEPNSGIELINVKFNPNVKL